MAEHRDGHGVQSRAVALEQDAQAGDVTGLRVARKRAVVETRHAAILPAAGAAVICRGADAAANTITSHMTG
jgi:hypothetical protein